jgi:hypothetical protein
MYAGLKKIILILGVLAFTIQISLASHTVKKIHPSKRHHAAKYQRKQVHHPKKKGGRHDRLATKFRSKEPAGHFKTKPKQLQINKKNITRTALPNYLLNSKEKTLVNFVRKTVSNMQYTAYKFGGAKIDTSRGIYIVDCSRYVDHILKNIYPGAYTSLTTWSGTDRPTTNDFYHYFTNLSDGSEHWNTVDDVEDLRPGDILVFRNKNRMSGHVMIVMDKPAKMGNTFLVRIADSAHSGHSKDTRMPHASGIGIGTMVLKVNPDTFKPYAYAWKVGSRWQHNVKFAMARPRFATVNLLD